MRLFVALELPAAVRSALVAWCPQDAVLRPVAAAALHVTLAFLGERDEVQARRAGATLVPLARALPDLSLGGVLWLPRRRPRVLAVAVRDGDGALGALQGELVAALEAAIGYRSERRAFLAHVTVARVRGSVAARTLEPPAGPGRFSAPALSLMRSLPADGGVRYEALERVVLSPSRA